MSTKLWRTLTIALGGFWLLDGVLQFQPAMFTNMFVSMVLAPNLVGQPGIIASIISFGIRIWSTNLFWFNFVAALIQVVIGALLILPLWTRARDGAVRFGLWLSVFWALVIWIFGEGFGNLFTGSASFYTGAPGSALLYAIIALFILDAMNENNDAPLQKLPGTVGVLFLVGAVLNLAPMFWQSGIMSNLAAVAILACLGIFLILTPNRPVAWVIIVFLVVVWWLGQSFGGLGTFPGGTATDPNSAPFLVLFLLPIFFMPTPQSSS